MELAQTDFVAFVDSLEFVDPSYGAPGVVRCARCGKYTACRIYSYFHLCDTCFFLMLVDWACNSPQGQEC